MFISLYVDINICRYVDERDRSTNQHMFMHPSPRHISQCLYVPADGSAAAYGSRTCTYERVRGTGVVILFLFLELTGKCLGNSNLMLER